MSLPDESMVTSRAVKGPRQASRREVGAPLPLRLSLLRVKTKELESLRLLFRRRLWLLR